jgi:hypothetical protein
MQLRQLVLLLVLVTVALSYVLPRHHPARRRMIAGRPFFGFLPPPTIDDESRLSKAAVQDWIVQKVDNFDSSNSQTYRQRYWYNNQWYQNNNIAFLMIGGEAAESPGWVTNPDLEWLRMARAHGALVFLLEHRYYGASQPTSDMTTNNMRFLSSKQALADAAAFITAMNQRFSLTNPKWVTFGGSYSGALSAWFRAKYPDLAVGAVGSSGPVQAVVNFVEYLEVVQTSLRTYSSRCADVVKQGFDLVQSMMATGDGRNQLKSTFRTCFDIDNTNPNEVAYFYESLIDAYAFTVQYSGDNAGVFHTQVTVPALCNRLTMASSALAGLQAANNMIMDVFGEQCLYNSYSGFIDYMRNTAFSVESSDDRSWIYQTCTEFGYYQSTEGNNIVFGNGIPVRFYVEQWCTPIFGSSMNNNTVYAAIDATNAFYGGRDGFTATNVVLPNGDVDPWHALGILNSNIPTSPSILIQGTAHCADMYPPSSSDLPGLTAARQTIENNVNNWLP